MIDALRQMFGGGWEPIVLDNERLDLAVARGAAYYGMVRRGQGVRIAAGLARTYYIGVESGKWEVGSEKRDVEADDSSHSSLPTPHPSLPTALCLVPAGVEPGQDVNLSQRRFDLLVSEPVEFPLYVSSTRLTDRPGELVAVDREQMTPLPPIRTVLRTRKKGESGRPWPSTCTPGSPRSARWICGAARSRASGAGDCNSTSARPRRPTWPPTSRRPRARASSTRRRGRNAWRRSNGSSAPRKTSPARRRGASRKD